MTFPPDNQFKIDIPEYSDWHCYMFGATPKHGGFVWRPHKGYEPNWFWRKMQYICFGNTWVKEPIKNAIDYTTYNYGESTVGPNERTNRREQGLGTPS